MNVNDAIITLQNAGIETGEQFERLLNAKRTRRTPSLAELLLPELIAIVNPREKVTAGRIKTLNGRLKDKYSPNEIKSAARVLARSEWHRENGQMTIDNLLAPTKFGRLFAKITPEDTKQSPADQDDAVRKRMIL